MTITGTMNEEIELTAEQQKSARIILEGFVQRGNEAIEKSTKNILKHEVLQVCQDLVTAGIPKQLISQLVCNEADKFNRSPDYIRTLIPIEFKNQAQADVAKSRSGYIDSSKNLPGIDHLCQHETKTVSITDKSQIQPVSSANGKTSASSYKYLYENALKEIEQLKKSERYSVLKKRITDLEQLLEATEKKMTQYNKDFNENFATKFLAYQSRIKELEKQNQAKNYIITFLNIVHEGMQKDPKPSDEMISHMTKDFVGRHYEIITKQAQEYKQEEEYRFQKEQEQLLPKEKKEIDAKVKAKKERAESRARKRADFDKDLDDHMDDIKDEDNHEEQQQHDTISDQDRQLLDGKLGKSIPVPNELYELNKKLSKPKR